MTGFVYFIEREGGDAIKIGWSKYHPSGRLAALQTGCPEPLDLVVFLRGSLQDESRLHRAFAPLQFRSEWFYKEHKLLDFVNYLTGHSPKPLGVEVSRQTFEDAVWDVLVTGGYDFPFLKDRDEYIASASGREWEFMFPRETLQ